MGVLMPFSGVFFLCMMCIKKKQSVTDIIVYILNINEKSISFYDCLIFFADEKGETVPTVFRPFNEEMIV